MARLLRHATAVSVAIGPFMASTDASSASTGLTISQADVRLKKNSSNWAQKDDANAAVHEEFGHYEVALNSTDVGSLGLLRLAVTEAGATPVWEDFSVIPANAYDSMFSTAVLNVNVSRINNITLQGDGTSTSPWRPA